MGQLRTFYEAIQTKVEAVMNGGDVAFLRVFISSDINLEYIARVPRFPVAVITENGGQVDTTNGKIWTGRFQVTIINMVPRDHINEEAILDLMDLGDLLIAEGALEYSTNISVWQTAESQADTVLLNNTFVIGKTYDFAYQLERA